MNVAGRPDGPQEHDEDAREGMSLLGVLRLCWGLAAVAALAGYSLVHTLSSGPPAPQVIGGASVKAATLLSTRPVYIGGKPFYPAPPVEPALVVHFACNQEDARIARIYDASPSGRAIILRIDQSPEEMRAVYRGTDPRYPKDTRIVTSPCIQSLIDYGDFP